MNNRLKILLLFIVDSLLVVGSVFLGFRLVTEGLIRNIHGLTITAILSLVAYYVFSYFFNLYWRDWEYVKCLRSYYCRKMCLSNCYCFNNFRG